MERVLNQIQGVSHEQRLQLMKAFGVSKAVVSYALNGRRSNATSKRIRHVALTQYNGYEVAPVSKTIYK